MISMHLYGLVWLLSGAATTLVSVIGGLVHYAVVMRRATEEQRGLWFRVALGGPALAVALGALSVVGGLIAGVDTRESLDEGWYMLPLLAFGSWAGLTWWLAQDLRRDVRARTR